MDDRWMHLQHLAEAELHIARGVRQITEQELLIADLDAAGHDTTLARSVLLSFHLTQAQHVAHREHILRELGE